MRLESRAGVVTAIGPDEPNLRDGRGAEMGPTCEVLFESDEPSVLDAVDAFLDSVADRVERTRKGHTWDLWIDGRPIHVQVATSPPSIGLSAGCNGAEDYAVLRRLAERLAAVCGGLASEPIK